MGRWVIFYVTIFNLLKATLDYCLTLDLPIFIEKVLFMNKYKELFLFITNISYIYGKTYLKQFM